MTTLQRFRAAFVPGAVFTVTWAPLTIHGNTQRTVMASPPQLRTVKSASDRSIKFSDTDSVSDVPQAHLIEITPEGAFAIYDEPRADIMAKRGPLNRIYHPGNQLETLTKAHAQILEQLKEKSAPCP